MTTNVVDLTIIIDLIMKKSSILLQRVGVILLLLFWTGCTRELYEGRHHTGSKYDKYKVSFGDFMQQTKLPDFEISKRVQMGGKNSKTDLSLFIKDTTLIAKYEKDGKVTYTMRLYPLFDISEPDKYYNLVYEKYGDSWNEIVFKNKNSIEDSSNLPKLESSEMVYNEKNGNITLSDFCSVINYYIQCNGSCREMGWAECDGFNCSTGQCVHESVTYTFCRHNENQLADNHIGDSSGGGGGGNNTNTIGIYIPLPYSGDVDPNNADFMLASSVRGFLKTISDANPTIKNILNNYQWLYPNIIDYFRKNGGMNFQNQSNVAFALSHLQPFLQYNPSDWSFVDINQFHYNAFVFLLNNPNTTQAQINWMVGNPEASSQLLASWQADQSDENRDFVEECIIKMTLNPTLYPTLTPFIIEKRIDDSQLDPCSQGVFQQVKNTPQCDFAQVLAKLGANGSIYTTTMVSEVAPSGSPAQTVRSSAYNYKIYISTNYSDKTKLFIAASMLHELVHAYFMSLYDDFLNQNPNNPSVFNDFAVLYQKYVDKNFPGALDDAHHEQMAIDYVNAIAAALQEFQPGLDAQVYTDLAWGGLQEAPIFNILFPAGSDERIRIKNRYDCEGTGHPIGQGTPNVQTPNGQPCN